MFLHVGECMGKRVDECVGECMGECAGECVGECVLHFVYLNVWMVCPPLCEEEFEYVSV